MLWKEGQWVECNPKVTTEVKPIPPTVVEKVVGKVVSIAKEIEVPKPEVPVKPAFKQAIKPKEKE